MLRVIQTAQAPTPVGPYSQGVVVTPLLFTAGQVGIDPSTGKIVEGGIEAQARQTLKNLRAIIEAAGGRVTDVVKTTVYLLDMQEFGAFNAVYAEFFPHHPPARTTVAVVGLPLGARVEIEAVASWH
jgi:reactive intermediate/imine deaminase